MEMYGSRLGELTAERGEFGQPEAVAAHERHLLGQSIDYVEELTYYSRKRVHNLKYYTWVEQQGKSSEELQAQWYQADYWTGVQSQVEQIDELIEAFNDRTGLLKSD
jgi:cysteine synthase A